MLAFYWGNKNGLESVLTFNSSLPNPDANATAKVQHTLNAVFYSQVVTFHAAQAWNSLIQFAELCNSLAYNRAETGIGLHDEKYAMVDAICALAVMAFLFESSNSDTPQRRTSAEMLAQICDTYGWLYYRRAFPSVHSILLDSQADKAQTDKAQPDDAQLAKDSWLNTVYHLFDKAEEFLLKGTRFDPKRAIIHYHLARTYMSCMELLWQNDPSRVGSSSVGGVAHKIDNFTQQALREWRTAKQYDQFGRLHNRLSWLLNHINSYRRAWEKRQLQGIAGAPDPEKLSGENLD